MSQGKTAADLSRSAQINKSYLSIVENDRVGVSVQILLRICRALNVEPNVILEWHQEAEERRRKAQLTLPLS